MWYLSKSKKVPQDYFEFKQFVIHQGDCAMKVTTEGCLFGALVEGANPKRILDIGAGTGLLSLMLAQKYPSAKIHAVELDQKAHIQAQANFAKSPWAENLQIHVGRIQDFHPREKFDLIVCNPPFFKNSLHSNDKSKNLAIHDAVFEPIRLSQLSWPATDQ